jgi:hypothetical protein
MINSDITFSQHNAPERNCNGGYITVDRTARMKSAGPAPTTGAAGSAFSSRLIFDERCLPPSRADADTYPVSHRRNEYAVRADPEKPLRAIA